VENGKKYDDISGQRFGRLIAIKRVESNKKYQSRWLCKCDCGSEVVVYAYCLKNGNTKSCGCLKKELDWKHGMTGTRIYSIWVSMKMRCFNEHDCHYKDYGNRGITVCEEWKNSFESFYDWSIANGYKDNLTIERIDVNGNYEPSNCKWITNKEQQRNKRNTFYLTYKDTTKSASEWSEITGINSKTIIRRIKNGWTVERTLTEKTRKSNRRSKDERERKKSNGNPKEEQRENS
jgi:hypothetical protein